MKLALARSPDAYKMRSGVYVGGIGSGGFEVRPDGRFYNCQIFNEWRDRGRLDAFFVHGNGKDGRMLSLTDLPPTAERIQGVDAIEYTGEFPKVKLHFPDRKVTVEFTSVFIPGDVKNSTLPATIMRVSGTGKLMFALGNKYRCSGALTKNSVALQSPEGGLAMLAGKGRPQVYPKGNRWMFVRIPSDPHLLHKPEARDPSKPDEYYAALHWEGTFDDEVIIAWHYPTSLDHDGANMGQSYANHFGSVQEVLSYMLRNYKKLQDKTEHFHRRIFHGGQPTALADAYAAQLSSFIKQSWYAKDGSFGVWEGSCCCCGLQTTDVSYYGSWLYAAMFPELEKSGLRLCAKFQREDGWIPHFFPGTFSRIDEYRRKDMNMQFVLMVYRDFMLWKDTAFLHEMFPAVKRAMECVYGWDTNGDLMPEVEGTAQTFDAWGFAGTTIYTGSLWLAALRAGAAMASLANDQPVSLKWSTDADTVAANIVKTFWNGEYFILAVDGEKKDEGCLIDALSGDWYCRLTRLGGILDDKLVKAHLKAVLKYNRKKVDPTTMQEYGTPGEEGFCHINGGYKDDRHANMQQFEPWTGMEYALAVHLATMGKTKDALQVVKDVHERKVACGMAYNHQECGGDYFRPMVIGALWDMWAAAPPRKRRVGRRSGIETSH